MAEAEESGGLTAFRGSMFGPLLAAAWTAARNRPSASGLNQIDSSGCASSMCRERHFLLMVSGLLSMADPIASAESPQRKRYYADLGRFISHFALAEGLLRSALAT